MGKRIVGYVISHSGKPGGPWEADYGDNGQPTEDPEHRLECVSRHTDAQHTLDRVREVHPAARILRLVRRARVVACPVHSHQIHGGEAEELRKGIEGLIAKSTKLQDLLDSVDARDSLAHMETNRAEEAAVVDAAMAFDEVNARKSTWLEYDAAEEKYHAACAALRAKRGG